MAEQLKELFSKEFIDLISKKIKNHFDSFDEESFNKKVFNHLWNNLELKERMRHISLCLNKSIPLRYEKQIEILISAKQSISYDKTLSLPLMVFQDFVEVFGLEDFKTSMKALEVFTIDSSSEFAIRHFILKYESETMFQMKTWAKSKNEHIRRLASEGCRPRLPWAMALPKYKKNPSLVLEILELLKNDDSKYVQKSIANNLNDISKDNPDLVVKFVEDNLGKSKNLDWICKHASRTLLKNANKKTLKLFGFEKTDDVKIKNFICDNAISIGDNLNFSFDIKSKKALGKLRVEYVIYYKKANGTHSKKIFMITQNDFKDKSKSFLKKQSFKNMTTRKHHLGEHFISIIINGEEIAKKVFILEV